MISIFYGDHFFLSNFYLCRVVYKQIIFPSSENAYQAAKQENKEDWSMFTVCTPGKAKRLGKTVKLQSDWEKIKDAIMAEIVLNKFEQNSELMEKLLTTGDEELVEGNSWGDTYWGQCPVGNGQNQLGKILMKIRNEVRLSRKFT